MSAETLRRAATGICEDYADNPFMLAVAYLLNRAADDHDETPCPAMDAALAVTRAYLGETP